MSGLAWTACKLLPKQCASKSLLSWVLEKLHRQFGADMQSPNPSLLELKKLNMLFVRIAGAASGTACALCHRLHGRAVHLHCTRKTHSLPDDHCGACSTSPAAAQHVGEIPTTTVLLFGTRHTRCLRVVQWQCLQLIDDKRCGEEQQERDEYASVDFQHDQQLLSVLGPQSAAQLEYWNRSISPSSFAM